MRSLDRNAWIAAARAALIADGVERVRVDVLARRLKITRGSFYWHFKDRQALLDALLADWHECNTAPFAAAVKRHDGDGIAQYGAIVDLWIEEKDYDPSYDAAVRDWARIDKRVATLVRKVDRERIRLFAQVFAQLGYERAEADMRARITYYHQVGYYALGVSESKATRYRLVPLYRRVLVGK